MRDEDDGSELDVETNEENLVGDIEGNLLTIPNSRTHPLFGRPSITTALCS